MDINGIRIPPRWEKTPFNELPPGLKQQILAAGPPPGPDSPPPPAPSAPSEPVVTPEIAAEAAAQINRRKNRDKAQSRASELLQVNQDFLKIKNPSNPQIAAQVVSLTEQCSAIAKLLLNQLDS